MTHEIHNSLFGVTKYVTIRSLSFHCTSPEGIKRLCCNNFRLCFSPVLRFNLVKVEIRELRPEVVAESDEVLVHYRSRTNM